MSKLVKDILNYAAAWNVPLEVNICTGKNWKEVTK